MWKFIIAEWRYWIKSPMTWVLFLVNTLLVFGAVYSDSITIGGGVGSVHKNAPYTIQNYYGVMSLIGLLMTTAFMNATANRDFQYNMYQLVYASPIKKSHYFFGKFIGAYTMAIIPILGVSVGSIIAPLMPGLQPERYGPFMWNGHIMGLLGFALPNIFIAGVLLFSLALLFRSNIVSFIGAMLILVFYLVSTGFTRDIQNEWLANLLDPFGFRPEEVLSKYATVSEKNLHATPLTGPFLVNRLVWIALAAILLIAMYARFSFSTRNTKEKKKKAVAEAEPLYVSGATSFVPGSANKLSLKLLLNLTRFEFKSIIRNPTFIILAVIGAINLIASLTSFTGRYGASQYPVTYYVVSVIQGSFYLFLISIITFYSGVVVWKERDAKINEIQDAAAIRTGLLFASKVIALIFTVALILCLTIVIGVIAQTCFGYHRYELGVYAKSLLGLDMLRFSYLIIIALLFHYLINNRYIAYFIFIAFIVVNSFLWSALEIKTNMVQYGAIPNVTYSDMNGFGPFVPGATWFNIYWALFVAIISIVVYSFYIRGKEYSFSYRWKVAGTQMKRKLAVLSIAIVLFISCSGFVYYNTMVLNKYHGTKEAEQMQIDYEKKYKKYENKPQPRYYKIDYKIDLQPQQRSMSGSITAWAKNRSAAPITELYFTVPDRMDTLGIFIDKAHTVLNDKFTSFRIMALDKPLAPGDSLQINITFSKASPGFENEVSFTGITQNGTFFHSTDILPVIGYTVNVELEDKNKRIKYKLPVRSRMPKLDEQNLQARSNTYISNDADWVSTTTTISTDTDQIAIAPGSLTKSWIENGRKYFHYTLEKESLNFYSFVSAKYEVARRQWNGIDIEVYYNKVHSANVPNMLNSVQKSLAYYTANFGPYYHKQARIIEFPRYQSYAQAFPGTMPYSESTGFISDLRNVTKDDIDFVFYVVAHEMGHQYWAHQLIGAGMQGSEMMSEGFAQYSSLMVMEKEYGKDKMKKFLKYEMDGYLRGRSTEPEAERPLIRTESQQYIHYQKASVVLYYLKEMIGEDKVNQALRSLIDSFAYRQPPYPTSLSALRAFKAVTPDSLQYLISDMFENITLFSNKVTDAESKKVGDEYEVTIKTSSEKFRSDSLGHETQIPVSDYIDIGVFGESKHKGQAGKPIATQRVKVQSKNNTYTFRVKEKPAQAGIDPYNYLIDRIPDDNLKPVN